MQKTKKIALYLMTYKGLKVLEGIVDNNLLDQLNYVCIGRDQNVENDYSREIEEICIKFRINYFFNSAKKTIIHNGYFIAISWRWIIKAPNPIIVLHDSLLPKYRGFAPLVNSLKNGENEIGVTALIANDDFDTGPIIMKEAVSINYPIKINDAIQIISGLYSKIVSSLFFLISNETEIEAFPQNEEDASYSLWLDDKDYSIDWSLDSNSILRFIDALGFPYLGARAKMGEKEIIIQEAEICNDIKIVNREPGKVVFMKEGKPIVVCGIGLLKIINAIELDTRKSIFPLKKFRIRFL
jgi:methionyl-tRNA formyltransferase